MYPAGCGFFFSGTAKVSCEARRMRRHLSKEAWME